MSAGEPDALRFALLGPVRAWRGNTPVDVGTPQQQAVLTMLLLRDGRPVDLAELVDGVWGQQSPRAAVGTVRTYASRLRSGLDGPGSPVLVTVGRGYALKVPDESLDVSVFERHVYAARLARAGGDLGRAAELLRAALALCEGRPLSGVPGPYADAVRDRLVERRLQVLHDRVEVDLSLGRHEQLVGELTELCREYPLREEFRGQLMLALYRSGRPAESLGVYADTARLLVAEFGADPGPELAKLHQRILRLDDSLAAPPVPVAVTGHAPPAIRPAQLPAGTADFTGRAALVAELTEALDVPDEQDGGPPVSGSAVVVSAVAGIGGVGKTTLAVHVAHLAKSRFVDGQLYVNLRGARPDPADPAGVLAGFLRALGVAETAIPDGLDERAALYRSVLSGRRVLVVLDDARDLVQVRPLLPGAASCAVIVTSRSRLATLPATRRVDLDVLEPGEAVALLARIIGKGRVGAEHGAALAMVGACGFLPLAVRIVGARLAARSGWTIAAMADRLADQRDRLAELRVDDLDVASCFRLGYDQLDRPTARVFRLLAVPDVPDIGLTAAAAALDLSVPEATEVLERLVDLAMLESTASDRYRYHDLLRLFARTESERVDTEAERTAVLARLLDFQLATARNAYRVVRPGHAISDRLAVTRSPGLNIPNRDDGLDWANHEYGAVLAVIEQAMAAAGASTVVGGSAVRDGSTVGDGSTGGASAADGPSAVGYPSRATDSSLVADSSRATDSSLTHGSSLAADSSLGLGTDSSRTTDSSWAAGSSSAPDSSLAAGSSSAVDPSPAADAAGLVTLAADLVLALDPLLEFGFLWSALVEPARAVMARATEVGDVLAEGRVGYMLGGALMQLGRLDEAQDIAGHAARSAQRSGDMAVRAEIATVRGLIMLLRKEYPLAIDQLTEAVTLAAACESRWGRANALLNLASALLNAGRVPDALAACQESIDLFQPIGDPFGEAYGLCVQGRVMRRLGDPDAAISALMRSVSVATTHRLPIMEVISLVEIADCHLSSGRFAEALTWAERGRATAARVRWERTEAESLALLGRALAGLGEPERSQACLHQAHGIYTRLGLPGADELSPLLKATP